MRDRKRKQCEANALVFYVVYSFTARPLTSFYDIIERTSKALKIRIYEYICLLTLLLSYSLTLSHPLNKDGWIPTRVGHECRG